MHEIEYQIPVAAFTPQIYEQVCPKSLEVTKMTEGSADCGQRHIWPRRG